jgi:N-acetylneuraminate lyase
MKLDEFRLIAAPFTPMHADGGLNLAVVPEQARHLVATGVRGAFVGGTTGEGQSLTVDERTALAEKWAVDPMRPKLEFFVHVGHNCQDDAVRLAAHARSIGADVVALHAPTWFKSPSLADLIEFCAPVAAAAAPLPFYLYDIPSVSGVTLSSTRFLATARPRIPTLGGVKFTNLDVPTAIECVQLESGGFDVLWGCDEALLVGIAIGAAGAVGSTYNFAAPLYQRIIDAVEAGQWDRARAEQAKSVAMVRVCQQFGALPALKFAMSLAGVDCGPVRAPLGNLSPTDQRRLRTELEQLGFAAQIAGLDNAAGRSVLPSVKSA